MDYAALQRRLSGEKAGLCDLEISLISAISAGLHMNSQYSATYSTRRMQGGGNAVHVASVSTVDVLFPGACLSFSIVEGALSV